jgi:hypothetical protein
MKYLQIEYADPDGILEPITLTYRLRNNPIVPKWIERVQTAQQQYTIDDARRFYGFGARQQQIDGAVLNINKVIELINSFENIIDRRLDDINDQDTLNYLHSIFEQYHGLLDKQADNYWNRAPQQVRTALADLNIAVHRCEATARYTKPRHVVTYYGLPKDRMLDDADYAHVVHTWSPGTVCLNYCEIGKTLEDLASDDDDYIGDAAFQPFRHYSADFVVRFGAQTTRQAEANRAKIYAYYQQHQAKLGPWQVCYTNGQFALADLEGKLDLDAVANRQMVQSVKLI